MSNSDAVVYSHKLDIFLIAVGSAGAVVTIYHCIMACWYDRHRLRGRQQSPQAPARDTENSVADLIPAHKYEKGVGLEGTCCAICLSEFEEGEQIRTLPECMHVYHVPCIDMWLYSNSSCPMCRTDATPSPLMVRHPLHLHSRQNSL